MSRKRVTPTVVDLQRQIDALQAQLARQSPPPAAETTLTQLRRQLKEVRQSMRESGGLISLDDERREGLLLRAIEHAKAPLSAHASHPENEPERATGATNAGLQLVEDEDA